MNLFLKSSNHPWLALNSQLYSPSFFFKLSHNDFTFSQIISQSLGVSFLQQSCVHMKPALPKVQGFCSCWCSCSYGFTNLLFFFTVVLTLYLYILKWQTSIFGIYQAIQLSPCNIMIFFFLGAFPAPLVAPHMGSIMLFKV